MSGTTSEKCFACGKPFKKGTVGTTVITEDNAQTVPVGPECYRKVRQFDKAGGYQPPLGGPKLFLIGSKG